MADSGVLSIRLPKEQLQRLDALAQSTKRSPSLLAAEAVAGYLAAQEWQIEAAEAGVAAAERGEVVPHEQVRGWLLTWGSDGELPPPTK